MALINAVPAPNVYNLALIKIKSNNMDSIDMIVFDFKNKYMSLCLYNYILAPRELCGVDDNFSCQNDRFITTQYCITLHNIVLISFLHGVCINLR